MELEGKTAIVTGASSGIGAATVRKLREAGVRVVGGARRVERIDADVALPLDVTDEESCAAFVARAAAELGGIDILVNNAGLALGRYPFTESTPEDEATVLHTNVDGADADDAALPAAHPRRRPHRLHGLDRRAPGVRERRRLRRCEVRRPRLHLRRCARTSSAVRSASRRSIRASSRPSSRSCASRATRRPRRRRTRDVEPLTRGRRRRLRPLRAHAPAARERGRDRGQGARPVERRPDRSQRRLGAAHDPRGIDLLHLRRPRRHRRGDERLLRARHALPLAARADGQRLRAAPALVGEGRVLLGGVLPPQRDRPTGLPQDSISIARERFVGDGMQERIALRNESPERARVRARARGRGRLRGHHLREGARLRPRRPRPRAAAAAAGADDATTRRGNQFSSSIRDGDLRHAGHLLEAGAARRERDAASRSTLEPRERWELERRRRSVARRQELETLAERASARSARARATSLAAWHAPGPAACAEDGRTCAARSTARSPTSPRCGCGRASSGRPLLRRRDAVVHDRLRARHADHVAADAALRAGARSGALEALAELQAHEDDPTIDAEPGKIVHEVRAGTARRDVVPALLRHRSTRRRSTSSCSRRCGAGRTTRRSSARCASPRCARSSGSTATATATATASSSTSAHGDAGSTNQSWKDSGDSQRFQDGSLAEAPIAPCEVQGYVYDAKRGLAELAREVWRDRALAERLEREADELRRALRRGVLDRRARRLLRARARRREAAGRLALLEHRPPALERDRPAGARRRGRRPADGRGALVGLGRPHDVERRRRATTRSRTTTAPSGPTTTP